MLDTNTIAANAINYMWSLDSNEQRAIALQELFEEHENNTISNTHNGTSTNGSLRVCFVFSMKLFESVRSKNGDSEFGEESENIHMDLDDILDRSQGHKDFTVLLLRESNRSPLHDDAFRMKCLRFC